MLRVVRVAPRAKLMIPHAAGFDFALCKHPIEAPSPSECQANRRRDDFHLSGVAAAQNSSDAGPLAVAYFGSRDDELSMQVSVEVAQTK